MSSGVSAGNSVVLAQNVTMNTAANIDGGVLDGNGNTISFTGLDGTWDYGVDAKSGTVENLTVEGAFRAVGTGSALTGDLIVNNCILDATYPIHVDSGNGYDLIVTNCTLLGWTSYARTLGSATFTNCVFGQGTSGYAFLRPYVDTVLTDCDFEEGFKVLISGGTVTIKDCTLNGVEITAANLNDLLYNSADSSKVIFG